MKSFVLPVALVASLCLSVSLIAQEYEKNIDVIRVDLVNAIKDLSQFSIDEAPYKEATAALERAQQVINSEAKNPKIVNKTIKDKLNDAIKDIRETLWDLQNYANINKKLNAVSTGIRALKPKLKGLKTGYADLYKTPTDLKKAVYAAAAAFIDVLELYNKTSRIENPYSVSFTHL